MEKSGGGGGRFDYLRKLMIVSGYLPLPNTPPYLRHSVTFLAVLSHIYLDLSCIGYLLLEEGTALDKSQAILIFFVQLPITSKMCMFILRRQFLLKLMTAIEVLTQEAQKEPSMHEIFNFKQRVCRKVVEVTVAGFLFMHVISFLFFTLKYMSDGSFVLPYQLYVPFDHQRYFYIACLHLFPAFLFSTLTLSSNICALLTFTMNISAIIKYLNKCLKKIGDPQQDFSLKYCIKYHQAIIRVTNDINDLLGLQLYFEYLISSLDCCIAGFLLVKVLNEGDRRTPSSVALMMFVITLLLPISFCFAGNIIDSASQELRTAVYNNNWYTLKSSDRLTLLNMITVTSKNLNLKYRNVITFDMKQYNEILKQSYSLVALLQRLDSK